MLDPNGLTVKMRVKLCGAEETYCRDKGLRLPLTIDARETVVAEKFQAMVMLGLANTRMKDFYDIWMFDVTKQRQWTAFFKDLDTGAPALETIVSDLAGFLMPYAQQARHRSGGG